MDRYPQPKLVIIDQPQNITDGRFGHKPEKSKANGRATLVSLMLTTKGSAKRRGYTFTLNLDQFTKIVSKNCFYCDVPPKNRNKYCSADGTIHLSKGQRAGYTPELIQKSWAPAHGIDRLDNTTGYEPGNCVPCCEQCNKMKTEMTLTEFIAKMKRIIAREEAIHEQVKRIAD